MNTYDTYAPRMNDQDALMLAIERDPLLRSTMVGIMTLDRSPDPDRFERMLAELVKANPRLRQRAVPDGLALAPPRWEPDPYFDLGFHFAQVAAPGAGTRRDLLNGAAKLAMSSFDLARPLWRLLLVDGLEGGRAALIFKVHHSVSDAVGFINVIQRMVQLGPDDAPAQAAETPAGRQLHPAVRALDASAYRGREAVGLAGGAVRAAAGAVAHGATAPRSSLAQGARLTGSLARVFRPQFSPLSPVMRERSLNVRFDMISVPMDDLRAAAKRVDGTLNVGFLAGIAGGLGAYHERHGAGPAELRVNMPINVRPDGASSGGNHFVPARFLLPVGIVDPLERMRVIRERVQDVRAEPALGRFDTAVHVLNRAPHLATPLFGAMLKSVDVNASNVPGVPMHVYCCGAKVEEMFPFGPLAGAAVNVSLLSYAGHLCVTLNTDTAAVPDGDVLHDCLVQAFGEVVASGR